MVSQQSQRIVNSGHSRASKTANQSEAENTMLPLASALQPQGAFWIAAGEMPLLSRAACRPRDSTSASSEDTRTRPSRVGILQDATKLQVKGPAYTFIPTMRSSAQVTRQLFSKHVKNSICSLNPQQESQRWGVGGWRGELSACSPD